MKNIFSKFFAKPENKTRRINPPQEKAPLILSTEPDMPYPFGYKISWIAVKTEIIESVVTEFGFENPVCANWESGIMATCSHDGIFVSPPVSGYVLIVLSISLAEIKHILEKLSEKFDEILFCGSHRTSSYCAWAKFSNGKTVRAYEIADDVTIDEGEMTAEEKSLGFDKFPCLKYLDAEFETFPDEEDVIQISESWGIDVSFNSYNSAPSTGLYVQNKPKDW